METGIVVQQDDPGGPEATELMREMTAEVSRLYGLSGNDGSGSFSPADVRAPRSAFVIARLEGKPVGCGALRPMNTQTAELKRMFVVREARRLGVGGRILAELERLAAGFDYRVLRLETGYRQTAAIALYEKQGFYHIPPFGRYVHDPISICFEKIVSGPVDKKR